MNELDKVLQAELDRINAEIVKLQARATTVQALLASQPGAVVASIQLDGRTEEGSINAKIIPALKAAGDLGLSIGKIADVTGVSKDVARRIMAGLAKEKKAIRKGDRALARWFAK